MLAECVRLAHSQCQRCDPDHIPQLRGVSIANRFTFAVISVIVLNSVLTNSVFTNPSWLMIDIAVWLIVVLLGAVVYIVWHALQITRAQHQSTMTALSSLGDTHKLGYEGLTLSVQRLEQRVKQLEERR
jgi:uncharacterized protein (DUF983 family)